MSRTLKYFLKSLAKLVLVSSAMFAYFFVATAVILAFFDMEFNTAVFTALVPIIVAFVLDTLWRNAKHKVEMENLDLIKKIKD